MVSFGLVVLIWLVQLVIYPAFASIALERFSRWHAGYTRTVTWIVAPLMLGQAGLIGWLVAVRPGALTIIASLSVAVARAVTARGAIPLHDRLQAIGPDPELVRSLVTVNWIRTAAWTVAFLCLIPLRP